MEPDDIDRVLLVGGSSNLQMVRKALENIFGREPEECEGIEINKMVGHGAGVYCGMKAQNRNNMKIIQKLSYSIGVRVGANFDKLIEKNERYGSFSEPRSYALAENKDNRDIEVYQGNSRDIKKCFYIGKISVSHLVLGDDKRLKSHLVQTSPEWLPIKYIAMVNAMMVFLNRRKERMGLFDRSKKKDEIVEETETRLVSENTESTEDSEIIVEEYETMSETKRNICILL